MKNLWRGCDTGTIYFRNRDDFFIVDGRGIFLGKNGEKLTRRQVYRGLGVEPYTDPVWSALGATTEAEALERITILQGIARGDLWVTPRHGRHYAVTSISGMHIGMWPKREDALAVMREYEGSSLTELVETGPPNSMPTLSAFVDDHNAVEALRLHIVYEALPSDRGGKNGPKGKAWAAFIAARDKVLNDGRPT